MTTRKTDKNTNTNASANVPANEAKTKNSPDAGFPIVGIGASAGGLEAF